jgi:PLP dependent protein
MSQYEKAWQAARRRVDDAVARAGRPAGSVRLLAVSKTFPAEAVRAVYALGQRAFGENYVKEAVAKRDALRDLDDVEWHLIGPLQSNKTAVAAESFGWIETVDRLKVAQRLSAQRAADSPLLEVCVQVNASGEASKGGVAPAEALVLARAVAVLPHLRLRGVMGIPAPATDEARQRREFGVLRACFEAMRADGLAVDTLSMGMSADLEIAIAEGATQVRVGTAIFGERTYA